MYFHAMRLVVLLLLLVLVMPDLAAQTNPEAEAAQESILEGLFDDYSQDDGGEIAPEWLLFLEDLLERPLDINQAGRTDLSVFFFLTATQIDAFLAYQEAYGPLDNVLELQVIPGFDRLTVKRLLPFIKTSTADTDARLKRNHLWQTGKREITFRAERFLEPKKGFSSKEDTPPAYEGDPYRLLGRIRYFSGNRVSYGVTFEKDAGETLFSGSNPQGFDFLSGHLFLRNPFARCEQLAIGDFGIRLGQGLLISTGFNSGKSASVALIKQTGRTLFPQNGWQESRFFRGMAAEWKLSERIRFMGFASIRQRDGNAVLIDSTDGEIPLLVTSLQQSGLHRTEAEIADEGVFRESGGGGRLTWQGRRLTLGWNGIYFQYDPPYQSRLAPYNQFRFNGQALHAVSLDYEANLFGGQLFGEVARSGNGGMAATSGWMFSPDKRLQISLLGRYFSEDYWTLWAAPFAESTLPINERGVYAGIEFKPFYGWRISGFVDLWSHPWLTFQSDSPVKGREHLIRVSYERRRSWSVYFQFRHKERDINRPGDTPSVSDQVVSFRQQLRMQWQFDVHRVMSFRTRMEWTLADAGNGRENGYLIAQDLLYKPVGSRLSGTMRLALFRSDGYASRMYMFENDLLYAFSLRPYYNHGQRFYINLRYKPWNPLTVEARYEVYRLFDQDVIGSGNEQIDGPVRTGIKCQVRYLF